MNRIVSLIILTILLNKSYSQDTLPRFTLVERNNRVTVSWVNPYESVIQLNVQRSFDSLLNFRTVFSPLSPELPQNGFTEMKMPTNQIFYRIFYVLKGGTYFFTKSLRIGADVARRDVRTSATAKGNVFGQVTIQVRDKFYSSIAATTFPRFRDSILHRTKDTLNTVNDSLAIIFPYMGPDNLRLSNYIYSIKEGIFISLPAGNRKYSVKFFEENGTPLFEIPNIREPQLTLDKTNFMHAGWFLFELYEDEKLKEKSRFYLSKDF